MNKILKEAIEYLGSLDEQNYYIDNIECMNGRKESDLLRVLCYITPSIIKIADYYILEWLMTKPKNIILFELEEARKKGDLKNVQSSYCFIEPGMQLYGSEDDEKASYFILYLLKDIWSKYLSGLSDNSIFIVEVDESEGRVEFYQKFKAGPPEAERGG